MGSALDAARHHLELVKHWPTHAEKLLAALVAEIDASPVGRIDFHSDSMLGDEICEFSPHGSRARAKTLQGQRVAILSMEKGNG